MTSFLYTFHACSHVSKESIWRFRWPLITYVTLLETGSTRGLVSGTLVVKGTLRVDNKSAKSTYSPLAAACAVFSVMFEAQLPAEGGVAGLVSGAVVCDEVSARCASFEDWSALTCFFNASCWSCMFSIWDDRLRMAANSTDVGGSSEVLSSCSVSSTGFSVGPGQFLPGEPN